MFKFLDKAVRFGIGYIAWTIMYPALYTKRGRKFLFAEILKVRKAHPHMPEEVRKAMDLTVAAGDSPSEEVPRVETDQGERTAAIYHLGKDDGVRFDLELDLPDRPPAFIRHPYSGALYPNPDFLQDQAEDVPDCEQAETSAEDDETPGRMQYTGCVVREDPPLRTTAKTANRALAALLSANRRFRRDD